MRRTIPLLLVVVVSGAACSEAPQVFSTTVPATEGTAEPMTSTSATAPGSTTGATGTTEPSETSQPGEATTTTTRPPIPLSQVRVDVEPIASGFHQPVLATSRRDDGRLFVVDQPGRIYAVDLFASGFRDSVLDISSQVRFGGEQGLLGVAFDPADPDRMIVHYTALDGSTVVAEYRIGPTGVADPFESRTILTVPQPAGNHNGGMIEFGPEGYLYIGLGDGGGANDQFGNGQDPHTLLGTILRIDLDAGDPYGIPPDNPFADGVDGAPEVWMWGLRNPWRFSFDRFDIWIGDVGQDRWEEIDVTDTRLPGSNAGWSVIEGTHCFGSDTCDPVGFLAPIAEYEHQAGRCSVTGGVVYRGDAIPRLVGTYLYGDYCTGEVWAARRGDTLDSRLLTDIAGTGLPPLPGLTSFGTGPLGEVYLLQSSGTVWQLVEG